MAEVRGLGGGRVARLLMGQEGGAKRTLAKVPSHGSAHPYVGDETDSRRSDAGGRIAQLTCDVSTRVGVTSPEIIGIAARAIARIVLVMCMMSSVSSSSDGWW